MGFLKGAYAVLMTSGGVLDDPHLQPLDLGRDERKGLGREKGRLYDNEGR